MICQRTAQCKKILLVLLLMPTGLFSMQIGENAIARERERKARFAPLAKVMEKYENWQWKEIIYEDPISQTKVIEIYAKAYERWYGNLYSTKLILSIRTLPNINDKIGFRVAFSMPTAYKVNWKGLSDAEKILPIRARFDDTPAFETELYSDNDPNFWFIKTDKIATKDAKIVRPLDDILTNKKFFMQFQTSEFSIFNGSWRTLEFDITGAQEIVQAAKTVLLYAS